jgi:hypothetical protein
MRYKEMDSRQPALCHRGSRAANPQSIRAAKRAGVLWATPLDPDRPGRKTVARAHLEEDGRVLVHSHFLIDDKGNERMMIEFRLTQK